MLGSIDFAGREFRIEHGFALTIERDVGVPTVGGTMGRAAQQRHEYEGSRHEREQRAC